MFEKSKSPTLPQTTPPSKEVTPHVAPPKITAPAKLPSAPSTSSLLEGHAPHIAEPATDPLSSGTKKQADKPLTLVVEKAHSTERDAPKLLDDLREHGFTKQQFDDFKKTHHAVYAESASAGKRLNSLNDHDGVLVVPGRDGGQTITERFAVVKEKIGGEEHFFIKGYGDRVISFSEFEAALEGQKERDKSDTAFALQKGNEKLDPGKRRPAETEHLKALNDDLKSKMNSKPWETPLMETPLRSEVLKLSLESKLTVRRNEKESNTKFMPVPPNPTEFPKKVAWANSEGALCPGAGPVLKNGTRLYQLDWNTVENRLMGFKNTLGDAKRQDAIMADTVKGQKAPAQVDGPVLFEIQGIKKWELMGPAQEQSGVKGGSAQRVQAAVGSTLTSAANALTGLVGITKSTGNAADMPDALSQLKPGAHIRLTTEDGAVHDLKLTQKGMSLSLAPTTAGTLNHHSSQRAFGVDVEQAADKTADKAADQTTGKAMDKAPPPDVNVYSYQGRNTGTYGTASGFTDPELNLSTGESLKAGPLLQSPGNLNNIGHTIARTALYQPSLGGEDRGPVARLVQTATVVGSKFLTTLATGSLAKTLRGEDGVFLQGAHESSGVGTGRASTGMLAANAALVATVQEALTAVKDAIDPMVPESWKNPSGSTTKLIKDLATTFAEEALRLEVNLGFQKALGLREGTPWDHGTVLVSSALKGAIETTKKRIGSRQTNPYSHMMLDTLQSVQYTVARATGIALSQKPGTVPVEGDQDSNSAGQTRSAMDQLGLDVGEALIGRSILRGYDQVVAPAFVHLLNSQGWVGENASPFDHQLARELRIEDFAEKFKSALTAGVDNNWEPLQKLMGEDGNVTATIRANLEALIAGNYDGPNPPVIGTQRTPEGTEFFSKVSLAQERVKQLLNRVDLYGGSLSASMEMLSSTVDAAKSLAPFRQQTRQPDLEANRPEDRVGRAVEYHEMKPMGASAELEGEALSDPATVQAPDEQELRTRKAKHYADTVQAQDDRITSAKTLAEGSKLKPGEASPTTNSSGETSQGQQAFIKAQQEELQGKHNTLRRTASGNFDLEGQQLDTLRRVVPQPAGLDFALRSRPADGKSTTMGAPDGLRAEGGVSQGRIGRELGTFSREVQEGGMAMHQQMTKAQGLSTVLQDPDLSQGMKDRMELAVRHYTVESQLFHYPLRWPVTGEPKLIPVAPGVQVAYNVMNKPGNLGGHRGEQVDPVEAVYANFACALAPKFPSDLLRAVVTEAAYKEELEPGEEEQDGELRAGGNKGVLTEIFSASASEKVAAEFNVPISGYGAVPRDRSQRMDVVQKTGVNIAGHTDLAQAEVILMPGAVFEVKHVDSNAGKLPVEDVQPTPMPGAFVQKPVQDIGQVVYMRQVDTYKLEQAFDDYVDKGKLPENGESVVDPDTGQFFKYVANPNQGDSLYDPKEKAYYQYDPNKIGDAGRGGLQFSSETKNYFLGKPLERATNPPSQKALWRHPYTSESAKRATKDAIHAAIVRGDVIVPHLNKAVKNLHHEHFREEGGFYEKDATGKFVNSRAQREADAAEGTKSKAEEIAKELMTGDESFSREQSDASTKMLAWLTASYLRTPIKLVPVPGYQGLGPQDVSITETYDKVDLLTHPLKSKPDPAVVIGVGEDGYYAMTHVDGKFKATHKIEGSSSGKSAENFLHAYLRAGPLPEKSYRPAEKPEPGQPALLKPDSQANESAQVLYTKLQRFASTDYLVLQQSMVDYSQAPGSIAKPTGSGSGAPDTKPPQGKAGDKPGGHIDPANISALADAFAKNRPKTTAWLKGHDVEVVGNSGGAANNCLIISLVQHATGKFDSEHSKFATAAREALVKRFPKIKMEDPLHSDTEEARWLADHIHTNYGQGPAPALWFLEPGDDGAPVPRQVSGTGADGSGGIITVANWGYHFEAVRDTKKQLPVLLPELVAE